MRRLECFRRAERDRRDLDVLAHRANHLPDSTSTERLARLLKHAQLAVVLVLSLTLPAGAQEDDPESIDDARAQRETAQAEAAEVAAELELLQAEDEEVHTALVAMDAAVTFQQERVEVARADIAAARLELARREAEVVATEITITQTQDRAARLAVDSYIGSVDPSTIWLSSDDIASAAREDAYLALASGELDDVADELERLRTEQETAALAAEDLRADLVVLEADLAEQLGVLEERRAVQETIRAELLGRIDAVESRHDALEAESAELTTWIQEETARQSARITTPSGLGFVMPTAGSVGSGFGPRFHPILGYSRMHNGVDIGAPTGQTVVAANSGVIIYAGWRGGYGNAVVIDHGGGVTSLSAHLSVLDATVGHTVERGERVGGVGSTGLSTGPHLHYEIRRNGVPVDPLGYLP